MIDTQSSVESEGEAFDERHVRACTLRAGAYLRPSYATVFVGPGAGVAPARMRNMLLRQPGLGALGVQSVAESPGLLH